MHLLIVFIDLIISLIVLHGHEGAGRMGQDVREGMKDIVREV